MDNKKELYYYKCNLIRVIDGDTIQVLVDLGFAVFKQVTLRLARINALELNTLEGKKAKLYLTELLSKENTVITFSSVKVDCYGRSIAEIYITNNISTTPFLLSDYLVTTQVATYRNYK